MTESTPKGGLSPRDVLAGSGIVLVVLALALFLRLATLRIPYSSILWLEIPLLLLALWLLVFSRATRR